jgi:tetratricopeptide (TPR) repeat protein
MAKELRQAFRARKGFVLTLALSMPLLAAVDPVTLGAARALYDLDELGQAKRAFEKLFTAHPESAEVNYFLGEIALRQNVIEDAIMYFEKAVAAAPTASLYHHRLGDAYGRAAQDASIFSALGLARKCLSAFEHAVDLDPGNLDARYSLFTFYLGAPGIIGGGANRAAAEAAAIKQRDADRGRIALAVLYVSQRKYDEARAELAAIRPVDLATVRGERFHLSDAEWSAAKVGLGEPARNHMWFAGQRRPGVVLIVHGRLYSKGLHAPSPSRYTYYLKDKWKVFTATVGLHDDAHEQDSAAFIVRGDGRELFRSRTLRVDESQRVRIEVAGVHELELVTEPGEADNHSSRAIWADPMVRR